MSNTKIMLVEADRSTACSLQKRLKNLGYEVPLVTASSREAIRRAEEIRPDLILIGLKPAEEMDEPAAVVELLGWSSIPLVYLTTPAIDENGMEPPDLTAPFGYLSQPFTDRELHLTIEMTLYQHRLECRLRESEGWLTAALKGIADGIIATDTEGRIKFMNPMAERLTGWSEAQGLGQELAEIFQLRYETAAGPTRPPRTWAMSWAPRQIPRSDLPLAMAFSSHRFSSSNQG